mmetsp:Transcript_56806/g.101327  ORF Transcript_56806/g.101327 Transcript_56806/m.101327 type:complete len:1174 (-) Transcript_56806:403-3924(-)
MGTEPAKAESMETEPAKAELMETESAKVGSMITVPAKAESIETDPTKAESMETEPAKVESMGTEPAKAGSTETEPAKVESMGTEPAKAGSTETEPAKAGSMGTEPAKAESMETEPAKAELMETESAKVGSMITVPAKAESIETDPTKAESMETEPAKVESLEALSVETNSKEKESLNTESIEAVPVAAESMEMESANTESIVEVPVAADSTESARPQSLVMQCVKAQSSQMKLVGTESAEVVPARTEMEDTKAVEAVLVEAQPVLNESESVKLPPITAQPVVTEPERAESIKLPPVKGNVTTEESGEAESVVLPPVQTESVEPALTRRRSRAYNPGSVNLQAERPTSRGDCPSSVTEVDGLHVPYESGELSRSDASSNWAPSHVSSRGSVGIGELDIDARLDGIYKVGERVENREWKVDGSELERHQQQLFHKWLSRAVDEEDVARGSLQELEDQTWRTLAGHSVVILRQTEAQCALGRQQQDEWQSLEQGAIISLECQGRSTMEALWAGGLQGFLATLAEVQRTEWEAEESKAREANGDEQKDAWYVLRKEAAADREWSQCVRRTPTPEPMDQTEEKMRPLSDGARSQTPPDVALPAEAMEEDDEGQVPATEDLMSPVRMLATLPYQYVPMVQTCSNADCQLGPDCPGCVTEESEQASTVANEEVPEDELPFQQSSSAERVEAVELLGTALAPQEVPEEDLSEDSDEDGLGLSLGLNEVQAFLIREHRRKEAHRQELQYQIELNARARERAELEAQIAKLEAAEQKRVEQLQRREQLQRKVERINAKRAAKQRAERLARKPGPSMPTMVMVEREQAFNLRIGPGATETVVPRPPTHTMALAAAGFVPRPPAESAAEGARGYRGSRSITPPGKLSRSFSGNIPEEVDSQRGTDSRLSMAESAQSVDYSSDSSSGRSQSCDRSNSCSSRGSSRGSSQDSSRGRPRRASVGSTPNTALKAASKRRLTWCNSIDTASSSSPPVRPHGGQSWASSTHRDSVSTHESTAATSTRSSRSLARGRRNSSSAYSRSGSSWTTSQTHSRSSSRSRSRSRSQTSGYDSRRTSVSDSRSPSPTSRSSADGSTRRGSAPSRRTGQSRSRSRSQSGDGRRNSLPAARRPPPADEEPSLASNHFHLPAQTPVRRRLASLGSADSRGSRGSAKLPRISMKGPKPKLGG